MSARILVLLLIFAIQACPFYCRLAVRGSSDQGPAVAACRCCGGTARQADCDPKDGSAPAQPSHPSPGDSGGRCICGGAVLDRSAPFEVSIERSHFDVVATTPIVAPAALGSRTFPDGPALSWRATPGRLVCCLNMSFLF